MLRLPDRLSFPTRAAAVAAACVVGALIGFADRYVTRMQLAPLEILPLAIVAWMLPLTISLPFSLVMAYAVAYEEYNGGYHVAGETLLEVTLSISFAYLCCVVLVSLLRNATQRSVATSEAQYRAIGDAIPYGVWSASNVGEIQYVTPSYLDLIGNGAERDLAFAALRNECARSPREPFEFEHEHRGANGTSHWIWTRGVPILGGGQSIQGYVGINLDITERKHSEGSLLESEGRYRYLAESIPQIVWICDAQARIEYFNERWYAFSGMRRGQPIRGAFGERLHRADTDKSFIAWASQGRDAHETYESEVRLRASDGSYRWFLSRALAQTDRDGNVIRWFGTSTDIDARKRAQDQLAFLARAGESLTETLDVESTCNVLARLAVPTLADWCGVFLLEGDDKIRTAALAHDGDDAARERAWVMERRYGRTLQSTGIIAAAMRTGEVQSAGLDDPTYRGMIAQDETHSRLLASLDFGAAIAVPMRSGLRTLGAILLIRRESGRHFEPDDYEIARELSRRATVSVENARAYDRERRVADALQAAFLPSTLPSIPGLTFDAVYVPGADESAIGGDWYDAFQLSDGRIALSIGDVAGRGLRAAVVMGRVREAIRAFALEGLEPAAILSATQRVLRVSDVATMVTAFVAIADPFGRTLTFSNAGHPPAMLALSDGSIETLALDGIPLGIFDDIEPAQKVVPLPDDALLVLYTDGLIEIDRDVVAGMQFLRDAIASAVEAGERTATAIYARVVEERPARDDVAIMTVATQRLKREPLTLDLPAVPESARLVRAALQRFAEAYALDDDQRFTLEVAVGEAVANTIEHAYGIGAGRFAVAARENGSDLEIEVQDQGQWRAPREEGRGRGMPIMEALAHSVRVDNSATGTTVHMNFTGFVERRTVT
jgi:PAS domain S-box-containing protein